jgi:hypothetical protein
MAADAAQFAKGAALARYKGNIMAIKTYSRTEFSQFTWSGDFT